MKQSKADITLAALAHRAEAADCHPIGDKTLRVRLRCAEGELSRATVLFKPAYREEEAYQAADMRRVLSDGVTDLYEAELSLARKRFRYYFALCDRKGRGARLTSDGFSRDDESVVTLDDCFCYPFINPDEWQTPPEWARGALIYQIWTDRFSNGDKRNDRADTVAWEHLPAGGVYYGGDFAGIVQKLDYLQSMGVRAVYLNPVFLSPSYHGYDIMDYKRVAPWLGGEDGLKKLSGALHAHGMRLILDAVFNHISSEHPIFKDFVRNGERSRYKDWFTTFGYPVDPEKGNYETFGGFVPAMPRLNTENPEVIAYLTDITARWTETLCVDGWRLDVADEVAHSLLRALKARLTAIRPDILILGEIWNQAARWLTNDEMHTVTNYKFRKSALKLASGEADAQAFWNAMQSNLMLYKTQTHGMLVNLLGSHDTKRLRTLLSGDEQALAANALMLMFMGAPLIYYGDEAFMEGGEDPDNRRAMRWDKTQTPHAEALRALCLFRARSDCLCLGDMTLACARAGALSFYRTYQDTRLLCAVNLWGERAELPVKAQALLIGNGECRENDIALPAFGYAVFRAQ